MKRLRQSKTALVSHSRWLVYAAAGAATSLGGAHSAEAEIHYSGRVMARFGQHNRGIDVVVPVGHNAGLHFDANTYVLALSVEGAAVSNRFCGYQLGPPPFLTVFPSRLPQGVLISNYRFFSGSGVMISFSPFTGGQFFDEGLGFIGFRFNNGAGRQYGWARVKTPGPYYRFPGSVRFLLVDYAWGDPGDQVKTGQTSLAGDQAEAVPDQGSLGLLALGSAGLLAWRRRRQR